MWRWRRRKRNDLRLSVNGESLVKTRRKHGRVIRGRSSIREEREICIHSSQPSIYKQAKQQKVVLNVVVSSEKEEFNSWFGCRHIVAVVVLTIPYLVSTHIRTKIIVIIIISNYHTSYSPIIPIIHPFLLMFVCAYMNRLFVVVVVWV